MDDKTGIEREAKKLYVDTEYSSRSHFEARRLWNSTYYALGCGSAVLTAVGAAIMVAHAPLGTAVTVSGAIFIGLSTFLDPRTLAQAHSVAGARLNALNGRIRYFGLEKIKRLAIEAAETELEALRAEKERLNSESPGIPRSAYMRARKGIQAGESSYKEDFDRLNAEWR